MKKLVASIISTFSSQIIFGQDSTPTIYSLPQTSAESDIDSSLNTSNSIESILPLVAITLVVILVIQLTRYVLDYKLKNKLIDRNISEQVANSILEKSAANKKEDSIKWAFLLLGLSGGLTVAYHTAPLHIHSIAIIAFSLGMSYLAHFFYLRKQNT
jgi:hypothetical protein